MASENVLQLTEANFTETISSGLTLVDFWASWCQPCLALAPVIDELADTHTDKIKVAKVDVDSNPGIPGQFGIRGIPTVILFKDGQPVDSYVGNNPGAIKEMVAKVV